MFIIDFLPEGNYVIRDLVEDDVFGHFLSEDRAEYIECTGIISSCEQLKDMKNKISIDPVRHISLIESTLYSELSYAVEMKEVLTDLQDRLSGVNELD